ncbi:hypothetical protein PybrP1_000738, partial [[Pythium] brassicae (nom. inval.)]
TTEVETTEVAAVEVVEVVEEDAAVAAEVEVAAETAEVDVVAAAVEVESEVEVEVEVETTEVSASVVAVAAESGDSKKPVSEVSETMTDGRNMQWEAPVRKRFTEFTQLHAKLQASNLPHAKSLPPLPPKGGMLTFLRGRQSKKVISERERRFTAILEFISRHRELANSSIFLSFLVEQQS